VMGGQVRVGHLRAFHVCVVGCTNNNMGDPTAAQNADIYASNGGS